MAVKKTKSKAWYTLIAPEMFGSREIGKTAVNDPKFLVGRKIIVSAVDVTNNFSKYYLKFSFRVSEVNGETARTEFDGSEAMRDYISRMILRHIRRIDSVQDLKTQDGIPIRIKSLAVVSRRIDSSVAKVIRRRMQELVKKLVEESKLEDLVNGMVTDKAKIEVLDDIRKIYPIRNFEFRKTEVIR